MPLSITDLAPLATLEPRPRLVPKWLADKANAYTDRQDVQEPRYKRGAGISLDDREGAFLRFSTSTDGIHDRPKAQRKAHVPQQRKAPATAAQAMARVAGAK